MVNWFWRKKKEEDKTGSTPGGTPQTESGEGKEIPEEPVPAEEPDTAVIVSQVEPLPEPEWVPEPDLEPESELEPEQGQQSTPETLEEVTEEELQLSPDDSGSEEILLLDDLDEDETLDEQSPTQKAGFFGRLRERLQKTRDQFANRVDRIVLGRKVIDAELLDELEEVLITSDLGVRTTQHLLRTVAEKIRRNELSDPQKLREHLREEIRSILAVPAPPWDLRAAKPAIIMVIGVNGVGKTTTIGKLAHHWKHEGLDVILAAGDTFRAAAIEQLSLWGERVGVTVIRNKSGSDPSAVAFDALDAAISRHADVVLVDTAGRMHTKVNLMEELKKVQRTISRKIDTAPHEVLLVLDASTGQNALSQARLFKESIGLTGLVLTKLDGTAKGGIVVAICEELQIPVRYIGIGESIEDLRPFDADEFTRALF